MMFETHNSRMAIGGVAGAAEDRVVEEEHENRAAAAERNSGVAAPGRDNCPKRPSAAATAGA